MVFPLFPALGAFSAAISVISESKSIFLVVEVVVGGWWLVDWRIRSKPCFFVATLLINRSRKGVLRMAMR